jgi:hypothetical protein
MQFSAVAFIFSLNLHFLDKCKCSDAILKVSDTYVCYIKYVLFLYYISDEPESAPSRPSNLRWKQIVSIFLINIQSPQTK